MLDFTMKSRYGLSQPGKVAGATTIIMTNSTGRPAGPARRTLGCGIAAITLVLAGCGGPVDDSAGAAIPPESRSRQVDGDIAPGDVLRFIYIGTPELNLIQKVRADGRVSLPMLGDVRAAGRSLSSFQGALSSMYKEKLQEPEVVVTLVGAASAVYVSGEVLKPGKVPLDRPITALEAIMESGGFGPGANPKKISVVRTVGGSHRRYDLDMREAMSGRAAAFYLEPYDVIHVSRRVW